MEYTITLYNIKTQRGMEVTTVTPYELHDACFQVFEFVKQHSLDDRAEIKINGRKYDSIRDLHDRLITPINRCSLAAGGCRIF